MVKHLVRTPMERLPYLDNLLDGVFEKKSYALKDEQLYGTQIRQVNSKLPNLCNMRIHMADASGDEHNDANRTTIAEQYIRRGGNCRMVTQNEAIIEAFRAMGGIRTAQEIKNWVESKHGTRWKDYSTPLADMVSRQHGGNQSSTVPDYFRVLKRVSIGKYSLIQDNE